MPKISLTIRVASRDNFLQEHNIGSYFKCVVQCLNNQIFKDFELIYVDTYQEENAEAFASIQKNFALKHVQIHPGHRYWYDQGCGYMTAATNTAIIHADGELIVSLDDAEFFDKNLLLSYWNYYKQGSYLCALHKRLRSIETESGELKLPIKGDVYINDSRMKRIKNGKPLLHHDGKMLFAGKSFSLEDALTLNGFNERMDGNCTLEDCEFGARLEMLGKKFALDPSAYVYILDHRSYVYDPNARKIERPCYVENFGIMQAGIQLKEAVANKLPITDRHLEIIRRETLKYRQFDILAPEHKPMLDIWMAVPNFDLREERKQLRNK